MTLGCRITTTGEATCPCAGWRRSLMQAISITSQDRVRVRQQRRYGLILALLVDLALLSIRRVRIVGIAAYLAVSLGIDHAPLWLSILSLRVTICRLITNRWEGRSGAILLIARAWNLMRICWRTIHLGGLRRSSLTFVICLASTLLFLLTSFPLLANLLEFFCKSQQIISSRLVEAKQG